MWMEPRQLKLSLRLGLLLPWAWGWTMRADSLRPRWMSLLLSAALLMSGCSSMTPPAGRGRNLGYTPSDISGPRVPEGSAKGGTLPRGAAEPRRQRVTIARRAVLDAVDNVKGSRGSIAGLLSKLAARPPGLGNRGLSGINSAFTRYLDFGSNHLPWLHGALGDATLLADVAKDVGDPDMELGLLQMTGPRLQAAVFGAMLLSAWLDFLQLADVVLRECPAYSVEKLLTDMDRVQRLIETTLVALASGEPEQVEAAATAMPELMGQLTREFASIRDGARTAMERNNQLMAAAQASDSRRR
jgi:hypothetical protein